MVWKKEYRQYKSAFKTEMIIKQLTRLQKEALIGGRRLDKVLEDAKKYKRTKIAISKVTVGSV